MVPFEFKTLNVSQESAVLFLEISAPPMNLNGPELVGDLASLIQQAEADDSVRVIVFKSADPDYFISHVDVTSIKENREAAAQLTGDPSIAMMYRHLSTSRIVSIAQIEGRVRGVGSEFVLACDMRFAARESAIFGQFEPAFGVIPGAGGAQHLARLMGRGRALEVMLSAQDYDAELAERYGWINRALPAAELGDFVRSLALRIAAFPATGHSVVKERVNAITLPPVEEIRRDSDLFVEGFSAPEAQRLTQVALQRGFQTRDAEMNLAELLGDLATGAEAVRCPRYKNWRRKKVMKQQVKLFVISIAVVIGVLTFMLRPSREAAAQTAPIFVKKIPAGYRDWKVVSVAHEAGDLNDIRAVLGNDVAIKAYREGKASFPDGAIVGRIAWTFVQSAEYNKVFGRDQSFVAGAPTETYLQFMVKDSKKYVATGGWGYSSFDMNGKPTDDAKMTGCFTCHQAVQARDFVFTRYTP